MKKKALIFTLAFIAAFAVAFFLGPKPDYAPSNPEIVPLDIEINQLDNYISKKEANITNLKKDNEARIQWFSTPGKKTEYSLVYLHGFSASQEEGDPIHEEFATRYGMNLYLARLYDHGRLDSNTFRDLTPKRLVDSAKEALGIAKTIGEKVIVMSTSTGSTLSAYLAAYNPDYVHSQIMYSPNIDIKDSSSELLLYPWGYQLSKYSVGGDYVRFPADSISEKYWNHTYHLNGILALKHLIDETMTEEVFAKISQPLFMGYYYKDEKENDPVVSVDRMLEFYSEIATPAEKKVKVAFEDVGRHVIASHLKSQDIESVRIATYDFAEKVLGLKPKSNANTNQVNLK